MSAVSAVADDSAGAAVTVTGVFELNMAPPPAAVPQVTVGAARERWVA